MTTISTVNKVGTGNAVAGRLLTCDERDDRSPRYPNFDYLRLFLAIEVIAGHLWAGLMRPGHLWIPIPAVAAFVGLSGFLIPQSLERSRDMWHFAWKRIVRTIPALIPLLVAIGIVFGFKRVLGAILQYLTAGYRGEFVGVTLPLWSLIVEDALYACMAVLFVFGVHRNFWLISGIVTALLVGGEQVSDYMTKYRLFDTSTAFFVGTLVYIFHERIRRLHWIIPGFGLLASLMGWLDFAGRLGFPFLIACVIILAITLPQLKWKIPDLSYGAYIWHAPILLALLAPVGMARAMPWVVATCLLTLLASLGSWYLVEKRALRHKDMRWPQGLPITSWNMNPGSTMLHVMHGTEGMLMEPIQFSEPPKPGLVSVIIPTYNKDQFIGATLDSISRQTYSNWEVIVVEDSSRGETENIVKRFARQHPRHRVDYSRNARNLGAAQSRNNAFKRARGEFIALLDADDRWLPDHLAFSTKALRESKSDLVYSSVLMIEDQTELPIAVWGPDRSDIANFPYGLFRRNFITPSATVLRREVITDVGPWGLGFRYCEDADYWFRCIAAGKTFQHVGGCHCLYRKNHDGATTQLLCGTLEEFGHIADHYSREIPGLKRSYSTKGAAYACLNAAQFHARTNLRFDPSANRARSVLLSWRAWQLRRNNLGYLAKFIRFAGRYAVYTIQSRFKPSRHSQQPVSTAPSSTSKAA
ncbi:MAG: glycosyltransferase [Pirellulales bacterium]|nr:glycosyltransferase [Pirellulales bacterium]